MRFSMAHKVLLWPLCRYDVTPIEKTHKHNITYDAHALSKLNNTGVDRSSDLWGSTMSKGFTNLPSPAGMSVTKLSLAGNN